MSLSCASAGDCAAGGYYSKKSGETGAFVANETNGTWGKAEEVPGMTADLGAEVYSLSCASAGNCAAGGSYENSLGENEAFVASETSGTWGDAEEVPGTASLNGDNNAETSSVSCASAGNCLAGGFYVNHSGDYEAFVATETSGTWATAKELPGIATLNAGGMAEINAVSCGSVGNCSAVGYYEDGSSHSQAFVATETSGTWANAKEIPGTATLNTLGNAATSSVSCPSAGNCAAGGRYTDDSGAQAFVVNETKGTWGDAEEVPGMATMNVGGDAETSSVSCASAGNCAAVGSYEPTYTEAFVVNETNGTWGTAEEVPGTAKLNLADAETTSVSCASAGNCAAGGYYEDSSHGFQAFVVSETSGTWGAAEEVPGTATLNAGGNAEINSVSCASGGGCAAGGYYSPSSSSSGYDAFVVNSASNSTGPSITKFTPTSGPPGTAVTIKGTNLEGTTSVTFNGVKAKVVSDNPTMIKVKVPTEATTGKITVTTPVGTATSATAFTVT